jgi:K+-sensing histidine kinase KdpD
MAQASLPLKSAIASPREARRAYGMVVLAVTAATLCALVLARWIDPASLVLMYVLAVIVSGLRYGSRPALLASTLGFLAFNFFLTEPRYTFSVVRQDELVTLLFLLLIALICGPVASRIRQQYLLVRELENERLRTEVEKLRSALLSSVSHDLRSPLSAMMGAAESLSLLDKQLNAQDRLDLIDTIVQESRRLDTYIQNLLDMTRLGYGTLKIERDWVSIADIIGSALTRLRRYHPEVLVETRFAATAPLLYVHAALIEQALFNILENATKYAPPETPITVSVTTRGATCIVAIEDRGPGIPEPLRERIFDMFFVVAEGDTKRQGTGMGLAICRGMIAAHRGQVWVETGTGGSGTRMIVELPIESPHNGGSEEQE